MKIVVAVFGVFLALLGAHLFADPPNPSSVDPLQLRDLDRYVRITDRPFEMHDITIVACLSPKAAQKADRNPHIPAHPQKAYCNVYVNAIAKETMISGKGTYPVGSIVIKSKLSSVDDQTPDLFTVMQKMPVGYDSERGDWKYSVVNGETYRQVAAGRIDSCIECHESYKETDYITRTYMAKKR